MALKTKEKKGRIVHVTTQLNIPAKARVESGFLDSESDCKQRSFSTFHRVPRGNVLYAVSPRNPLTLSGSEDTWGSIILSFSLFKSSVSLLLELQLPGDMDGCGSCYYY